MTDSAVVTTRHTRRVYASHVNSIEEDFEKLTDAELRAGTDSFRKRLADGEEAEVAAVV
jgi:preprotein translocase subunit SecA